MTTSGKNRNPYPWETAFTGSEPGAITPAERPVTLYVDGYNIIFRRGELKDRGGKGMPSDGTMDAMAARDRLVTAVKNLVERHPGLSARVYYDGPVMSRRVIAQGVEVIYSGGEGRAHRADEVIIQDIMARPEGQAAVIVTADRSLRDRARHRGAGVMSPGEFLQAIDSGGTGG